MSILEDGPLRRIIRERLNPMSREEQPEDIVRRWREKGVPKTAVDMAMKMADNWLKGVLK